MKWDFLPFTLLLLPPLLWEGDGFLTVPTVAVLGAGGEGFRLRALRTKKALGTHQGGQSCGGDGRSDGIPATHLRFTTSRRGYVTHTLEGTAGGGSAADAAKTTAEGATSPPGATAPQGKDTKPTTDKSDGSFPGSPSPPTRAPRLYLGGSNLHVGQIVQLTPEQTRYLLSVMRLRDGSLVRVFDGINGEFLAAVSGSGGRRSGYNKSKSGRISMSRPRRLGVDDDQTVMLRVDYLTRRQPGSWERSEGLDTYVPDIELIFAPIRKQRLKVLVEKVVEIGATRLTPVLTARTQKGAVSDAKTLCKLGSVTAVEAAEQCERMTVPLVEEMPVPLLSLLENLHVTHSERKNADVVGVEERDIIFVCKERDEDAPPILEAFAEYAQSSDGGDLKSRVGKNPGKIALLVGPEGGFDPDEIKVMALNPFVRFVSLGPTVLRAETAAVYALSSWSAFWAARR